MTQECTDLETFRRTSDNLYERVRALFFLYAIHRFHLPQKPGLRARALIPYEGYTHLLQRRFEEAIETFLEVQERFAPNLIVGLARMGGQVVGIVAQQPRSLAGVLDIDASDKGSRFIRFCDCFNIPLLT